MMISCVAVTMAAALAGGAGGKDKGLDEIGRSYVHLVLALGVHDADFVDAYYGPPEWRTEEEARKRPLADIQAEARQLLARLKALPPPPAKRGGGDDLPALRREYLTRQLEAV